MLSNKNPQVHVSRTQVVAVDYLTVTTKTDEMSADLIHTLLSLRPVEFWIHEKSYPWKFKGFAGRAYEGIRYGMRGPEAIVMLSGPACQNLWSEIAPKRHQCTRVDLAVTVTLVEPEPGLVQESYTELDLPAGQRSSLVLSNGGGSTLYVGSRQSETLGRLYDKGAEQGLEPGLVFRWEVEVKKPRSEHVVARLLSTDGVVEFISAYVYTWFTSRGVKTRWIGSDTECAIEVSSYVATAEKQLEWLRTQVKPTVAKLKIAGLEEEVCEALGLPLQQNLFELFERENNGN